MKTGERIKNIRKQKGISQKELGTRLGVSQQMIGQYETNTREPKIETLRKIANALEVKLSDFLEVGQIINQYNSIDETMDSLQKKEDGTLQRSIGITLSPMLAEKISIKSDPLEKEILSYFDLLNLTGKQEAIKRVKELSELSIYNRRHKGTMGTI